MGDRFRYLTLKDGGPLIKDLKVVELKEALEARGLSKLGNKRELVQRLSIFVESHQKSGSVQPSIQAPNQWLENEVDLNNDFLREYFQSQKALFQEHLARKTQIGVSDALSGTASTQLSKPSPRDEASSISQSGFKPRVASIQPETPITKSRGRPKKKTSQSKEVINEQKIEDVPRPVSPLSSRPSRSSARATRSRICNSFQETEVEELDTLSNTVHRHTRGQNRKSPHDIEIDEIESRNRLQNLKIKIPEQIPINSIYGGTPKEIIHTKIKVVQENDVLKHNLSYKIKPICLSPQNAEVSSSVQEVSSPARSNISHVDSQGESLDGDISEDETMSPSTQKFRSKSSKLNIDVSIHSKRVPAQKHVKCENISASIIMKKINEPAPRCPSPAKKFPPPKKPKKKKFQSKPEVAWALSHKKKLKKDFANVRLKSSLTGTYENISTNVSNNNKDKSIRKSSRLCKSELDRGIKLPEPVPTSTQSSSIEAKVFSQNESMSSTHPDFIESLKQQIEMPLHIDKFPSEKSEVTSTSELLECPKAVEEFKLTRSKVQNISRETPIYDAHVAVEGHLDGNITPDSHTDLFSDMSPSVEEDPLSLSPPKAKLNIRKYNDKNIKVGITNSSKQSSHFIENIINVSESPQITVATGILPSTSYTESQISIHKAEKHSSQIKVKKENPSSSNISSSIESKSTSNQSVWNISSILKPAKELKVCVTDILKEAALAADIDDDSHICIAPNDKVDSNPVSSSRSLQSHGSKSIIASSSSLSKNSENCALIEKSLKPSKNVILHSSCPEKITEKPKLMTDNVSVAHFDVTKDKISKIPLQKSEQVNTSKSNIEHVDMQMCEKISNSNVENQTVTKVNEKHMNMVKKGIALAAVVEKESLLKDVNKQVVIKDIGSEATTLKENAKLTFLKENVNQFQEQRIEKPCVSEKNVECPNPEDGKLIDRMATTSVTNMGIKSPKNTDDKQVPSLKLVNNKEESAAKTVKVEQSTNSAKEKQLPQPEKHIEVKVKGNTSSVICSTPTVELVDHTSPVKDAVLNLTSKETKNRSCISKEAGIQVSNAMDLGKPATSILRTHATLQTSKLKSDDKVANLIDGEKTFIKSDVKNYPTSKDDGTLTSEMKETKLKTIPQKNDGQFMLPLESNKQCAKDENQISLLTHSNQAININVINQSLSSQKADHKQVSNLKETEKEVTPTLPKEGKHLSTIKLEPQTNVLLKDVGKQTSNFEDNNKKLAVIDGCEEIVSKFSVSKEIFEGKKEQEGKRKEEKHEQGPNSKANECTSKDKNHEASSKDDPIKSKFEDAKQTSTSKEDLTQISKLEDDETRLSSCLQKDISNLKKNENSPPHIEIVGKASAALNEEIKESLNVKDVNQTTALKENENKATDKNIINDTNSKIKDPSVTDYDKETNSLVDDQQNLSVKHSAKVDSGLSEASLIHEDFSPNAVEKQIDKSVESSLVFVKQAATVRHVDNEQTPTYKDEKPAFNLEHKESTKSANTTSIDNSTSSSDGKKISSIKDSTVNQKFISKDSLKPISSVMDVKDKPNLGDDNKQISTLTFTGEQTGLIKDTKQASNLKDENRQSSFKDDEKKTTLKSDKAFEKVKSNLKEMEENYKTVLTLKESSEENSKFKQSDDKIDAKEMSSLESSQKLNTIISVKEKHNNSSIKPISEASNFSSSDQVDTKSKNIATNILPPIKKREFVTNQDHSSDTSCTLKSLGNEYLAKEGSKISDAKMSLLVSSASENLTPEGLKEISNVETKALEIIDNAKGEITPQNNEVNASLLRASNISDKPSELSQIGFQKDFRDSSALLKDNEKCILESRVKEKSESVLPHEVEKCKVYSKEENNKNDDKESQNTKLLVKASEDKPQDDNSSPKSVANICTVSFNNKKSDKFSKLVKNEKSDDDDVACESQNKEKLPKVENKINFKLNPSVNKSNQRSVIVKNIVSTAVPDIKHNVDEVFESRESLSCDIKHVNISSGSFSKNVTTTKVSVPKNIHTENSHKILHGDNEKVSDKNITDIKTKNSSFYVPDLKYSTQSVSKKDTILCLSSSINRTDPKSSLPSSPASKTTFDSEDASKGGHLKSNIPRSLKSNSLVASCSPKTEIQLCKTLPQTIVDESYNVNQNITSSENLFNSFGNGKSSKLASVETKDLKISFTINKSHKKDVKSKHPTSPANLSLDYIALPADPLKPVDSYKSLSKKESKITHIEESERDPKESSDISSLIRISSVQLEHGKLFNKNHTEGTPLSNVTKSSTSQKKINSPVDQNSRSLCSIITSISSIPLPPMAHSSKETSAANVSSSVVSRVEEKGDDQMARGRKSKSKQEETPSEDIAVDVQKKDNVEDETVSRPEPKRSTRSVRAEVTDESSVSHSNASNGVVDPSQNDALYDIPKEAKSTQDVRPDSNDPVVHQPHLNYIRRETSNSTIKKDKTTDKLDKSNRSSSRRSSQSESCEGSRKRRDRSSSDSSPEDRKRRSASSKIETPVEMKESLLPVPSPHRNQVLRDSVELDRNEEERLDFDHQEEALEKEMRAAENDEQENKTSVEKGSNDFLPEEKPFTSARKVTLNRNKNSTDEEKPKKRKWGSSHDPSSLEISSESLKTLVPDVKPLSPGELTLQLESGKEIEEFSKEMEEEAEEQKEEKKRDNPAEQQKEPGPKRHDEREIKREKKKEERDEDKKRRRRSNSRRRRRSTSRNERDKDRRGDSRKIRTESIPVQKIIRNPPSCLVLVRNLVRPFTLNQIKNLLQRTGKLVPDGFWIDSIKSKCIAKFENEDQALETRMALNGIKWPSSNPKNLHVDYCTQDELNDKLNDLMVTNFEATVEEQKIDRRRFDGPVREWDLDKVGEKSPGEKERERERKRREREEQKLSEREKQSRPAQSSRKEEKSKKVPEVKSLDDLFNKTKSQPSIYWLPLTSQEIIEKEAQRRKRMDKTQKLFAEIEAERAKRQTERAEEAKRRQKLREKEKERRNVSSSRRKSRSRSRRRSRSPRRSPRRSRRSSSRDAKKSRRSKSKSRSRSRNKS